MNFPKKSPHSYSLWWLVINSDQHLPIHTSKWHRMWTTTTRTLCKCTNNTASYLFTRASIIIIISRFSCWYRISHFGSGVNNRSRKKTTGSSEIAEDELMLVESSWYKIYISVIPRLIHLIHEPCPCVLVFLLWVDKSFFHLYKFIINCRTKFYLFIYIYYTE